MNPVVIGEANRLHCVARAELLDPGERRNLGLSTV